MKTTPTTGGESKQEDEQTTFMRWRDESSAPGLRELDAFGAWKARGAIAQAAIAKREGRIEDLESALRDLLDAFHAGRLTSDSDSSVGYIGSLIEAGECALAQSADSESGGQT